MNELLQYALVGDLLAGGETREKALELVALHKLRPEAVTNPALRTVYDLLVAARTGNAEMLRKMALGKTSVETLEKAVAAAAGSLVEVEQHVTGLQKGDFIGQVRGIVDKAVRDTGDVQTGAFFLNEVSRNLKPLFDGMMSRAASEGIDIGELVDPIPEEEDPDCLFRGRWLVKGAPLVLTSVSGSGKSVITLQLAYAWALGRSIFGIEPRHPLKIGIFQTEDDDSEMAGFRNAMRLGYQRFHGWTPEDIALAESRIRLFPMHDGKMGDEFIAYLRRVQQKEHCDLVVVNPLQGVTDFDISDNTAMREFVRQKLDGVIKHDADTKCALMLVHHTNKPPAANARAGFGTDQYAQYVGAGASELTNWMRAMLAIMPTAEPGQYWLVAAKRGERLGWPKGLAGRETVKPTRIIRHSTPDERVLFWHDCSTSGNFAAAPEKVSKTEANAERLAEELRKEAMTLTKARALAKDLFRRSPGDAAYDEIINNIKKYDLRLLPTGKANMTLIGTEEGVKNQFSKMQEKAIEKATEKLAKMKGKE